MALTIKSSCSPHLCWYLYLIFLLYVPMYSTYCPSTILFPLHFFLFSFFFSSILPSLPSPSSLPLPPPLSHSPNAGSPCSLWAASCPAFLAFHFRAVDLPAVEGAMTACVFLSEFGGSASKVYLNLSNRLHNFKRKNCPDLWCWQFICMKST